MPIPSAPVTIVGGGTSGLALGLALKHKGISAVVYDQSTSSSSRHNHGLTLHSSIYKPLLEFLQMEDRCFREMLAVDAAQGGVGDIGSAHVPKADAFRCHRGRLEALLSRGLSITRNKTLEHVQINTDVTGATAFFADGTSLRTQCLIACDGPHSAVRQSICKGMNPQVLPFAVYYGKRKISTADYSGKLQSHLQNKVMMQILRGNVRLELAVNDLGSSSVDLGYVYSRPVQSVGLDSIPDPLFSPKRPLTGAADIPEEFFREIARLKDLEAPFDQIFDVEQVRKDRLLHWLMRTVRPEFKEVMRLASKNIILIGDAVHATPILGGEGANLAIKDAIDLAEHMSARGTDCLGDFLLARSDLWGDSVNNSEIRIQEMHAPGGPSLCPSLNF